MEIIALLPIGVNVLILIYHVIKVQISIATNNPLPEPGSLGVKEGDDVGGAKEGGATVAQGQHHKGAADYLLHNPTQARKRCSSTL